MKTVWKISRITVLALLFSVIASLSAFAASEKKVETKEGGSVTVSNVTEEIKFVDEGAGVGDTIYVAVAPVKVTINGSEPHPNITFRPEAKLSGDYFDIGAKFENVAVTGNAVELTKPGYYAVEVAFGSGYTNLNVAQLAIQVMGNSQPSTEPEVKSEPKPGSKPTTNTVIAVPTASKVSVNSKDVSFEAYNINGNNFFKLRDLAKAVNGSNKQFEVGFDQAKNAISLTSGKAYTSVGGELEVSANSSSKEAVLTTSKVYLDGKELQLTAYNIGGNNYFKLRDVAQALNIGVIWDSNTNTIGIDTQQKYTEDGNSEDTSFKSNTDKLTTSLESDILKDPNLNSKLPNQLKDDKAIFLGDKDISVEYLKKYQQYFLTTVLPKLTSEFPSLAANTEKPVFIITSTEQSASQWTDSTAPWGVYNGKYILIMEHHRSEIKDINPIIITHEFVHFVVDKVLAKGHQKVPTFINEGMAHNLAWKIYENRDSWKSSYIDGCWDSITVSKIPVPDLWTNDKQDQWTVTSVSFLANKYGVSKLAKYLEAVNVDENAFTNVFGVTPQQFQKEYEIEVSRIREQSTARNAKAQKTTNDIREIATKHGLVLEAEEISKDSSSDYYIIKDQSGAKLADYIQHFYSDVAQSSILLHDIPGSQTDSSKFAFIQEMVEYLSGVKTPNLTETFMESLGREPTPQDMKGSFVGTVKVNSAVSYHLDAGYPRKGKNLLWNLEITVKLTN